MRARGISLFVLRAMAFLAFVWLCRKFFSFGEVDACIDDGGVADTILGVCTDARHGQWQMVSGGSYLSWLTSLGLPAIIVLAAYALVHKWLLLRNKGSA